VSSFALYSARHKAFQLVCLPAGLAFIVAFFLYIFEDRISAYSVLLGGAAWSLPGFYFVWNLFSKTGTAKIILYRFYRAEIGKLLFSAVLFILIAKFLTVNIGAVLLGFGVAQLSFWLAPVLIFNKN